MILGRRSAIRFPGYFHAGHLGQGFDCLDEVQTVVLHQKSERRTRSLAPEAVVELLVGHHVERRRLLLVERAAGLETPAGFLQRDARIDDIDDVCPVEQIVYEGLRNAAGPCP